MRLYIVTLMMVFASTSAAKAAELQYSLSGPYGSFQYVDSSAPTPVRYTEDLSFKLNEVGVLDGKPGVAFDIDFFSIHECGGFTVNSATLSICGPQLYSGAESAPVFVQGSQPTGDGVFKITAISATPEPSSWALMILGIGGIGLMLRRARRHMLGV